MGEAERQIEKEGWRDTFDQSDFRCSRGGERERKKRTVGRGREEIERASSVIEPYMATVKHEAI